jgi:hypothetical protein
MLLRQVLPLLLPQKCCSSFIFSIFSLPSVTYHAALLRVNNTIPINRSFVIPASEPESRFKNKEMDSGSEAGMTAKHGVVN